MPLPGTTGKAGELVVVMNKDKWNGAVGDSVFSVLAQPVYGLPQAEPMFNVVHIAKKAFTKIFQTHRNLMIVHFSKETEPRIELKFNVYSKPQIVVEIWAPNEEKFFDVFTKNQDRIIKQILKKEQSRILTSYNAQLNNDVVAAVREQWNVKLSVPKGYNLVREEEDVFWIRYETKDVTQSILIYSEPYERQNTFTEEGMVEVMDRFSKQYVPGPDPGTYMKTYTEYPPRFEETALSGVYASRLKGLWDLEGGLMGGPFVMYSIMDESRNRVLHLHGFVFAPGVNKRNLLRQVDAIINSLDLQ